MQKERMVATASASGCADDACSELDSPEKPVPYTRHLCLYCPVFLKIAKTPEQVLYTLQSTTGQTEFPPALYNFHRLFLDSSALQSLPVGTKFCRSAETSCRRQIDSKQRTDSAWHGVFRHMWPWSCFLSCFELKEACPSILEPSMVHGGSENQICHLI